MKVAYIHFTCFDIEFLDHHYTIGLAKAVQILLLPQYAHITIYSNVTIFNGDVLLDELKIQAS